MKSFESNQIINSNSLAVELLICCNLIGWPDEKNQKWIFRIAIQFTLIYYQLLFNVFEHQQLFATFEIFILQQKKRNRMERKGNSFTQNCSKINCVDSQLGLSNIFSAIFFQTQRSDKLKEGRKAEASLFSFSYLRK